MPEEHWSAAQVKEYVERIFDEGRRATMQAERERELAASALREGLFQSIRDGDERLREHVHNQFVQIQTALASAEALEQQRIENAQQRVDALRAEMLLLHEGSEKAINKAEVATERRFESVNEFRAQLGDQVQRFMPREVAEAQFGQHANRIGILEGIAREGVGVAQGTQTMRQRFDGMRTLLTGAIGVVIAAAGLILAFN